jgi:hypothetical protein
LDHIVLSGELFMLAMTHSVGFDIRQQLDFDPKGRAACPACTQGGKTSRKISALI